MGFVWSHPTKMHFGFCVKKDKETNLPVVKFLRPDANKVTMNGVDVSETDTFKVSPNKGNVIQYWSEPAELYNLVVTTEEFLKTVKMEICVEETGERFLTTQNKVLVGTHESCDMILPHTERIHAIILLDHEDFKVHAIDGKFKFYDMIRKYRVSPGESKVIENGISFFIPKNSEVRHRRGDREYTISVVKFEATKLTISSTEDAQRYKMIFKREREAAVGGAHADRDGKRPAQRQ
jgi:hypothetical protein